MKFANAVQQRLADVEYAVAAQALEGQVVSVETQTNLRRVARGEISSDECRDLIRQKYGLKPR